MKIQINFDNCDFPSVGDITNQLLFIIFWEIDGSFYPSDDWEDFGCILLGWWVTTVIKLLRGDNDCSFSFMDGPYSLSVKLDRLNKKLILKPRGIDTLWEVSFVEVIEALIQAIDIVHRKFVEEEVNGKERAIFSKYSELLEKSLLDLK